MAIIGTYLSNLTNPINIKAKLLYIVSFEGFGINTISLFEYRTPYDNVVYNFAYYDQALANIGFAELNIEIVYFRALQNFSNTFVFFEIEDNLVQYFFDQLSADKRRFIHAQSKDGLILKLLLQIREKILSQYRIIDILTVDVPPAQTRNVSLPFGTKAIQVFEEGLTNVNSVGNIWFYDGSDMIPIIPMVIYPIGANFSVINRDTANLRRVFVMCLG